MTLLRITTRQPAVIECRCSPAILALSLADPETGSLIVDYRAAAGYELRTTTTTANVLNTEKIPVRISCSYLLLILLDLLVFSRCSALARDPLGIDSHRLVNRSLIACA